MSLPVGATLVPVLFASDATHLTNFSGDGKLWPLYMSIGNIKSSIRNRPTSYAWVPVAILPIGPKRIKKVAGWSEENQEQEANQILHDLLTYILRPLSNTSKDVKVVEDVMILLSLYHSEKTNYPQTPMSHL